MSIKNTYFKTFKKILSNQNFWRVVYEEKKKLFSTLKAKNAKSIIVWRR